MRADRNLIEQQSNERIAALEAANGRLQQRTDTSDRLARALKAGLDDLEQHVRERCAEIVRPYDQLQQEGAESEPPAESTEERAERASVETQKPDGQAQLEFMGVPPVGGEPGEAGNADLQLFGKRFSAALEKSQVQPQAEPDEPEPTEDE